MIIKFFIKSMSSGIEKQLKRYINELDSNIMDDVNEIINSTSHTMTVYTFGDGCRREQRDHLHMCMLLSATLKQILYHEDECHYDGEIDCECCEKRDKFKEAKKALEHARNRCWFFEYPDYIMEHFSLDSVSLK